MSSRLPVIAGLVSGVVAAAGLLVLVVNLAPEPGTGFASPTLPSIEASASPSSFASAPAPIDPSASSPSSSTAATPAPTKVSPSGAAAAFHVGEPPPPLVVPQLGGGRIDISALRGKPVWVNFMATWCPPCADELPLMNGYAARYADEGLVVVAIDVREEEGTVTPFVRALEVTFPVGLDRDGTAQRAWEAMALPVHFWIDADGVVREGALGGIGPDIMADGLRAILPGVEVTP